MRRQNQLYYKHATLTVHFLWGLRRSESANTDLLKFDTFVHSTTVSVHMAQPKWPLNWSLLSLYILAAAVVQKWPSISSFRLDGWQSGRLKPRKKRGWQYSCSTYQGFTRQIYGGFYLLSYFLADMPSEPRNLIFRKKPNMQQISCKNLPIFHYVSFLLLE